MENLIIHISGASGSGKTTLGNKLKEHFKSKIIVKDLDDLRAEFIKLKYGNKFNWENFDSNMYQSFLDKYILSQKKPLVLVGLNHMFWHNKKLYYNVNSQYNYYIEIDDMLIVKQKCIRFLTDELKDMVTKNKTIIRDITEDNEKFVRLIKENIERECGTKETLKINKMWKKDYEKQGYKFMSRENIYKSVVKILNNKFSK
jgi:uridine kinase